MLVLKCGYHSSRVSPFSTLARANENQISPTVAAARPARRVPAHPADAGTPRSGKKEKLFRKIVILQHQQNQVRPMCGGCAHFGANKSHLICVTIVMQNVLRLLRLFGGWREVRERDLPINFHLIAGKRRKGLGIAGRKGLRMQM